VARLPSGLYRLEYVEVVEKPEDMDAETFEKAVEATVKFAGRCGGFVGADTRIEKSDGRYVARLRMEGSLGMIATGIVTEFLNFTRLGSITLRDILILSGIGIASLRETFEEEAGRSG
jgi:hypothetical protein